MIMTVTMLQGGVFLSGLAGGAINAASGGGVFVTFPALLFCGVNAVSANATAAVATFPAQAANAWSYRAQLKGYRREAFRIAAMSVIGGAIGGGLLLWIDNSLFAKMAPFLMLIATVVFSASPWLKRIVTRSSNDEKSPAWFRYLMHMLLFLNFVYGGFFGAGMGIIMLSILTLLGMKDMHEMNALRTIGGVGANCLAIGLFLRAGLIEATYFWPLVIGMVSGGVATTRFLKRIDSGQMRRFVVLLAWVLTVATFIRRHFLF